ncbi:MAG: flagellar basal body P-ring formation protein FlgA [Magnetococcales bacterium]|nr:flagellar basal body P-ring formation protein FlgA [Magnetococcales bacterium]MBF0322521.1 flagellar basal body P-ring formation protein FlgA [Magnetococcales bacterium]
MSKSTCKWGILLLALGLVWGGDLRAQQIERGVLAGLVENALAAELARQGEGFSASRVYCRGGLEVEGNAGSGVLAKDASAGSVPEGGVAVEGGQEVLSVKVEVPQSGLEPGRREFSATVLEHGVPKGQVQVTAIIRQERSLLVLRRPMQRGEVVREDDLEERSLILTRSMPGVFGIEQMKEVSGQMARRALQPGVPLQMGWFESPMAVDRGEPVKVRLHRGGLKIETSGVALAKGRVGESIEVQNPDSRRRFLARVVGPGRVEVMVP